MTDAPERIWAKPGYDSWNAYGHWYEDATGGGTEYTRADIARPMTVAEAAKVLTAPNFIEPAASIVKSLRQDGYLVPAPVMQRAIRAMSQGGE